MNKNISASSHEQIFLGGNVSNMVSFYILWSHQFLSFLLTYDQINSCMLDSTFFFWRARDSIIRHVRQPFCRYISLTARRYDFTFVVFGQLILHAKVHLMSLFLENELLSLKRPLWIYSHKYTNTQKKEKNTHTRALTRLRAHAQTRARVTFGVLISRNSAAKWRQPQRLWWREIADAAAAAAAEASDVASGTAA